MLEKSSNASYVICSLVNLTFDHSFTLEKNS
jgi:hypothetical protein